jgi:hypothetical protein
MLLRFGPKIHDITAVLDVPSPQAHHFSLVSFYYDVAIRSKTELIRPRVGNSQSSRL